MTVDVQIGTVIGSIAGLSISGVNIKDIDEIPENAEMFLPCLFLNPDEPISEIAPEFVTTGSMGTAKMNLSYTLHYLYLHAKVGSSLTLNALLPGLITSLSLIFEAIMSNDVITGAVDIRLNAMPSIGVITGPTGAQFHGCALSFRVTEFVQ